MNLPILSVGRRVRLHHVRGVLNDLAPRPQTALDAGCGDGRLASLIARRFPGCQALGVDIDCEVLALASAAADQFDNLEIRTAEIGGERLGRSFDLVVCVDVLEHVADEEAAMEWLASHLSPNGHLIVHVPASPQRHALASVAAAMDAELAAERGPHLREGYDARRLRDLAVGAGLLDVSVSFTFHHSLTRLAADIDTWTYLHRARALKAVLLPGLITLGALEAAPSAARVGNGLLLLARQSESGRLPA